jgi:hypothetical protein
MYDSLETRFAAAQQRAQGLTARGVRTTKLQLAFDALNFADGNVAEAKAIIARRGERISARTWHKAIEARIACSPVPYIA